MIFFIHKLGVIIMANVFNTIKYQQDLVEKKLKKLTEATSDEALLKNYTKEDFIDVKTKWDMLNYSEEDNEIIEEYADLISKYLNLSVCAYISRKKLNNLNTFENAEKKNLTKEMTDEQKDILKKISKQVKIDRVLFLSEKFTCKIALFMAVANFVINMYWKDLYNAIQPAETYTFICVAISFLISYLASQHTTKKIANNILKIVKMQQR